MTMPFGQITTVRVSDTEAWEEIPHQERSRLVAAARLTLLDLTSMVAERENARRYFAKPGEAEWGC